jgi:cytochrome c2
LYRRARAPPVWRPVARIRHVQSEHPAPVSPAPYEPAAGAGLYEQAAGPRFPRGLATFLGVAALVLSLAGVITLVKLNPAFEAGTAFGTAEQIGQPVAAAAGGGPAAEGAALIATKPCPSCHVIPGVKGANGTIGPSLAGVASRPTIAGGAVPNTGPDDIKHWILDPPAVKPGTAMPNVGLTDDEATKIAAYLETLK